MELSSALHELFSAAFKTNAEIEQEEISTEDAATLKDLDPLEVLENLKDLVVDLLNEKKGYRFTATDDLKS